MEIKPMAISSKFILFIRKRFIRKLRFRQKKKKWFRYEQNPYIMSRSIEIKR